MSIALAGCTPETPGPAYPVEQDWQTLCGERCAGPPVQIRVGSGFSCVRYNSPDEIGGTVLCWGAMRGVAADLGVPPLYRPGIPTYDWPQITMPEGIVGAHDLAAGGHEAGVIQGPERRLWLWFYSDERRVPQDWLQPDMSFIEGSPGGVCGGHSDGSRFSLNGWPVDWHVTDCAGRCGVDDTGDLYCWGGNYYGQAGPGGLSYPVDIHDVIQVEAEDLHTCALESGGDVYCWGSNADGAIAREPSRPYYDDEGNYTIPRFPTPQHVEGLPSDIVRIAGSEAGMCALAASGQLYCWGTDYNGAMRLRSTDGRVPHSTTPVAIEDASDLVDFDTHLHHGCGIRRSGEVVCFGSSRLGQIGPEPSYVPFGHMQPVRGLPEHGEWPSEE